FGLKFGRYGPARSGTLEFGAVPRRRPPPAASRRFSPRGPLLAAKVERVVDVRLEAPRRLGKADAANRVNRALTQTGDCEVTSSLVDFCRCHHSLGIDREAQGERAAQPG